jgi:hypothetical protein
MLYKSVIVIQLTKTHLGLDCTYRWEISIVCFDELGRSPPHLFLYLVLLFKEKDGSKKGGSAS